MQGLDSKDRKLLYYLDINSRQSIQQLAKKIGRSKDAVKYRINKLVKEGVIKSFNAVIDTGKLGFISFRLALTLYNTDPKKEKEIIDFLLQNKNLIWLVRVEGGWDINTVFLYKSIKEMNDFWEELLRNYNNYIANRELAIFSDVVYFSRAYLIGKEHSEYAMSFLSLPKDHSLDSNELKIISILSDNARTPVIELARITGLTPKTIIAKIKKLEQEKIILAYRTEFDLEKLGYNYYKIHMSTFKATEEKIQQFKQYLKQHPNIIYQNEVLGGYDIEFEVQIENAEKLRSLIDDIRSRFSDIIKNYDVLHYYKEYRLRFFPSKN